LGRCCGDRLGGNPDHWQAVEEEAKNKSISLFSSRASGAGCSNVIEYIGVENALVRVSSSSVIVVVDMAGVVVSMGHRDRHRMTRAGCFKLYLIL
jgi:hypothetical protein